MKFSGKEIFRLYYDGFRSMTVGRSLWLLIIIKLIVIFAILKVFFFQDKLASEYDTDAERADAVRSTLTYSVDKNNPLTK